MTRIRHRFEPRRVRLVAIVPLAALVSAASAGAQRARAEPPILRAGAVVRIDTRSGAHRGALARDLVVTREDTAELRPCSTCATERYPLDSADAVFVRAGSPRGAHARLGAALGAVAGAAAGIVSGTHTTIGPGHPNNNLQGPLMVVGAGAGALIGGIVGAAVPARDAWAAVRITPRR